MKWAQLQFQICLSINQFREETEYTFVPKGIPDFGQRLDCNDPCSVPQRTDIVVRRLQWCRSSRTGAWRSSWNRLNGHSWRNGDPHTALRNRWRALSDYPGSPRESVAEESPSVCMPLCSDNFQLAEPGGRGEPKLLRGPAESHSRRTFRDRN